MQKPVSIIQTIETRNSNHSKLFISKWDSFFFNARGMGIELISVGQGLIKTHFHIIIQM